MCESQVDVDKGATLSRTPPVTIIRMFAETSACDESKLVIPVVLSPALEGQQRGGGWAGWTGWTIGMKMRTNGLRFITE